MTITLVGRVSASGCWLLAVLVGQAVVAWGNESRPNIVILMADDLRADYVGQRAGFPLHTPTMDRLVARGRVFRHAYCLGSNSPAVCLPSRNMFLTGRTYFRWPGEQYAPAEGPSLPRTFGEAGYDTLHVGKRGNVAVRVEKLFHQSHYLQDEQERRSGEPGRAVIDRALEWLAARPGAGPYLMYLAFEAPHDPRVAHERFRRGYVPEQLPLPANFLPEHPFDNGELRVRDEQLAAWPRAEREIRGHIADYAAVVTGLDHHLGRLMARLEELGQMQRTLVILASDNGLALGSHGLMGKQSVYEHSMGVPLVVAGPGIEPGETEALAYLHDVFPTLCEWSGVAAPAGLDGMSLAGVLRDPRAPGREELLLAYRDVQRAIRDRQWKLICYPKLPREQLFDLLADPDERRDLAAEPAHAERVRGMLERLRALQSTVGDDLALRGG